MSAVGVKRKEDQPQEQEQPQQGQDGTAVGHKKLKSEPPGATVSTRVFGKMPEGTEVHEFTLKNLQGAVVKIIELGATITEVHVPDKKGELADVVLGFDTLDMCLKNPAYFGCICGRVANRVSNAQFEISGKEYKLESNRGKHHLHGGPNGISKKLWKGDCKTHNDGSASATLSYTSKDGEGGYPGDFQVEVKYTLTPDNCLRVDMEVQTNKITPCNLASHSYWNLAGHSSGDILGHELTLLADNYTPTDHEMIPNGAIESVSGRAVDFTKTKTIGQDIKKLKDENKPEVYDAFGHGYDHNFVLRGAASTSPAAGGDGSGDADKTTSQQAPNAGDEKDQDENSLPLHLAAQVYEPKSGRLLELLTSEPAMQLYTANWLDGSFQGKQQCAYKQFQGFCLETQHYPDAVHQPKFPSIILHPGSKYRHTMVHKFSTR